MPEMRAPAGLGVATVSDDMVETYRANGWSLVAPPVEKPADKPTLPKPRRGTHK